MAIQSKPLSFIRCILMRGMLLSVLMALTGCQSLNSRWAMTPDRSDLSGDDDWAPPKVNSRYTKQQPYSPKTTTKASFSDSSEAVTVKPGVSNEAAVAKKPDIMETDTQEIDVPGAIAALPPSLQELARKQIEAVKTNQNTVDVPSNRNDLKNQVPSSKVTARISDRELDAEPISRPQEDALQHSSLKVAKQTAVARDNAAATSVAVAVEDKSSDSSVVTASAIVAKPMVSENTSWNHSLSDTILKLENEIRENSFHDENLRLSQEMTLRFLYLANRKLEDAARPIEGLDDNEQEYLRYQVQALFDASNPDAMPVRSRRWSLVMNSQRTATNKLAAASNLEVRSAAFCSDVQNYGVITKFPKYIFKPDQEVLLYCELENVFAQEVKNGFETQLQGTYEVIDANGRRITDQLLPMEKEICQNHRRDYFIIYKIFMPAKIEPGQYQMRVMIEDMKGKKFGQTSLDFQVQP
jgi:hypothetical protein